MGLMFRAILIWLLLTLSAANAQVALFSGASLGNSVSPIGMNLAGPSYFASEQPFANVWLNANWFTVNNSFVDTNEEGNLCLDSNGYVTSLTGALSAGVGSPCTGTLTATKIFILIYRNLSSPFYPSGVYDVNWTGTCSFTYNFDAAILSHVSSTHDTITVTPSANGIGMTLTSLGGSGCTGVSVTRTALTAAYQAGCINNVGSACFDPNFIAYLKGLPVGAVRFMEWMFNNGYNGVSNPQTSYATRPIPTQAFFGVSSNLTTQPYGVPVETMVSLCNTINADCWFPIPVLTTSNYWTGIATYVHNNLNSNLHVFTEYSNETWNFSFPQATTIQNAGIALWGTSPGCPTSFNCNRDYHGMQSALICQAWKTAWGADAARVICELGAQAAGTFTATYSASCPEAVSGGQITTACSSSTYGLSRIAIAPYFGCDAGTSGTPSYPTAWLSDGTNGETSLFAAITSAVTWTGSPACTPSPSNISLLAQSSNWETSYTALLPLGNITGIDEYEGGQQFTNGAYPAWGTAMLAMQSDSRMGSAITSKYSSTKSNGIGLSIFYNDLFTYTTGYFGTDQNLCGSNCSSPSYGTKYQALQAFIASNPCKGWTGMQFLSRCN